MNNHQTYDDVLYKRNYLTEVVARVDFVSPMKSVEHELPKDLSQAILKRFPIAEPRPLFLQHVNVQLHEDKKEQVATTRTEFTEWNFHGRNREKRFTIIPSAVFVQYSQYLRYEDLREEFVQLLTTYFGQFQDAQPSRLGLRYINKVQIDEPNPMDWAKYFDARLISLFEFPKDKALVSRAFHNIEFAFDESSLRYQFGMHNPDYPARIKQKVFILDLDAYKEGAFNPAEIPDHLNKFHMRIQEYFELSITDALRGKLNA